MCRPSVVQDALQRDVFWNIPYDKKVRQGTHLGQPIVITAPQSVAAKSLSDLATVIAGGRHRQAGKDARRVQVAARHVAGAGRRLRKIRP